MTTNEQQAKEVIVGKEPAPANMEVIEWGREVERNEIPLLRESLRQLVTLATALLGGAAVLFDNLPAHDYFKLGTLVLLLLSLAAGLWGSLPYSARINSYLVSDVRKAREDGIAHMSFYLKLAAGSLLGAFGVLLLGALVSILLG